eukprot:236312_1
MPSLEQQQNYLKQLRNGSSINPSIHPEWTITNWLFYWFKFPIEYSLIFLFVIPACILSFLFGIYDFIKNLFTTNNALIKNNLKDNLNNNPQFNLNYTSHDNKTKNNNEILSIIIPCYNESNNIKPTLMYLDINCFDKNSIEILLVDGNSPDINKLTQAIEDIQPHLNIKSSQIKIITKPNVSGRGTCQNVGVACSNGEYLLFVHADTIVPKHYDKIIKSRYKKDNKILLGAFTFAIDRSLMQYPVVGIGWVEAFARFRNKLISLPYGDQGLFIKREKFIEIGGFKWIPILDDIEFVFRCREIATLKKQKIYIDENYAYCSPRRWQNNGVAKNTVWNQWILFLYTRMKLTPEKLYQIYYGRKL